MESNSNRRILDQCYVYLSGPINFAKDNGLTWRKKFKELCREAGLSFVFFDPTDKPKSLGDEVNREKELAAKYRKEKDWDGLQKHAKKFVRTDLRLCDLSDIIVAYIDTDVFITGTWHEVIVGLQQKKPVLFIVKQGKAGAPDWLFGISDHNYIFDTVEDCVSYLYRINNGDIELNDKFVLVRNYVNEELYYNAMRNITVSTLEFFDRPISPLPKSLTKGPDNAKSTCNLSCKQQKHRPCSKRQHLW